MKSKFNCSIWILVFFCTPLTLCRCHDALKCSRKFIWCFWELSIINCIAPFWWKNEKIEKIWKMKIYLFYCSGVIQNYNLLNLRLSHDLKLIFKKRNSSTSPPGGNQVDGSPPASKFCSGGYVWFGVCFLSFWWSSWH